jgi:S-formylglutathione hydrolase
MIWPQKRDEVFMSTIDQVSEHGCYGGVQRFYKHASRETRGTMKFSVYLPPQSRSGKVPVLYYLSGLTCTEETFPIKAHAQQVASELGLMLVAPDTSPREPRLPGDADSWDFGQGAGFYVDATQAPWATNYRMYSYVTRELPEIVTANLPADAAATGIFGHSMGGHGALTCALRNPSMYRSRRRCNVPGAGRLSPTIWVRTAMPGASTMRPSWLHANRFRD